MAIYLVMKNNLVRAFQSRSTYLCIVLIPLVICIASSVMVRISAEELRIGLIGEEASRRAFAQQLEQVDGVVYEVTNMASQQTDLITQKYHMVIDTNDINIEEKIREITALCSGEKQKEERMSEEQQMFSLLMVSYLVIATIYASKLIKDRKDGTYHRFLATGYGSMTYRMGYVVSTFAMVFLQLVVACLLFGVIEWGFACSIWKVYTAMLLIAIVSTSVGVIVTSICKSELSANLIASSVAVLLGLLGGGFIPISKMPYALQVFANVNPVNWIIRILQ